MITKTELFNANFDYIMAKIKADDDLYLIREKPRSDNWDFVLQFHKDPVGEINEMMRFTEFKRKTVEKLKPMLPKDGCMMVQTWERNKKFFVTRI